MLSNIGDDANSDEDDNSGSLYIKSDCCMRKTIAFKGTICQLGLDGKIWAKVVLFADIVYT